MRLRRFTERDVEIPACANPKRRAACATDLAAFKEIYCKPRNYIQTAPFQVERMQEIQHMLLFGGQCARAEPRSSAKTTDAQIATIWALLYGYHKFIVFGRETGPRAFELIQNVKHLLETSEELHEDFPEICVPIRALEGSAMRCRSQTVAGERTRMEWRKEYIKLPEIEGYPGSGGRIVGVGFESSPRGFVKEGYRPTFVFLDDLETRGSVRSATMTLNIETGVLKDIMGCAGPGHSISILWAGTIIERNSLIARYTDQDLHPEWQGRRRAAIIEWPVNAALWDKYTEIKKAGLKSKTDLIGRGASDFYLENRDAMDAGAVTLWPENYSRRQGHDGKPLEFSNLQKLHNDIAGWGLDSFMSEYQNDPPAKNDSLDAISPDTIQGRLNRYPERVVPPDHPHIVQFIDIGARELHYAVTAYKADGTCAVIDYDVIETHTMSGNVKDADSAVLKAMEWRVIEALRLRHDEETAGIYRDADGHTRHIDLTLIDGGWLTDVIARFIRERGNKYRLTFGRSNQAGRARFHRPTAKDGVMVKTHFYSNNQPAYKLRAYFTDVDHYKLHTHERFLQDPGTPGACTLFGEDPRQHHRYAGHLCSERYDMEKQRWVKVGKWNHFFDCQAGCHAAADMRGVNLFGDQNTVRPERRPPIKPQQRGKYTMPDGRAFLVTER